MSRTRKIEEFPNVLIVEGYSELLFFAEMLEYLGKHGSVYIKENGGKTNLESGLEVFLTPDLLSQKTSIAVIADADANAVGTQQRIAGLLERVTGQKVSVGAWTAGPPRLGFFVAPGDDANGEIETLAWNSWANAPVNAQAKDCIESYLRCMSAAQCEAKSVDKGRVGALLALKNDEDPRLGPGALAQVFDSVRTEFASLLAFLNGF